MKQKRWILLMILLLGLAGLACGSFLGDGEADTAVDADAGASVPTVAAVAEVPDTPPTPTVAAAPQEAAVADDAGEAGGEDTVAAGGDTAVSDAMPATFSLNAANQYGEPSGVNSYRTSLEFRFTAEGADGSQTVGLIQGEGARIVDPHAMTLDFTAEGVTDFGGGQSFTFTQIGATDYFILPGGQCATISGDGDSDNPYSVLLDAGGMLGDLEGAALVEQGVAVNGVMTDHYRFDETHLNPNDPETGKVTAVTGDLYIASNGGYVVRLVMNGRGVNNLLSDGGGEGEIYYELNYYDFDQPVEIMPPAGCAETAAPDYPMLDDATNLNAMAGLFTYETAQPFDAALDFYKTEMAAAGWTLGQEIVQSPTATLMFTGDGGAVQINLGPAPSGGVLVAIVELP